MESSALIMNHCSIFVLWSLAELLQWDCCAGQRLVQMQEGPLYRARGYPITIACNVSGFKGSTEQDFEFSIYLQERPEQEIKIISTQNPGIAYANYFQRVKDKEIEIERKTGSSVLLHIKDLHESDEGEYECFTPNTDGKFHGVYSAKMNLTVIQDTLTASMTTKALHMEEGETLQLECEVSTQTLQHTHTSVTWYLNKTGLQPLEILSLMSDFTLRPGAEFEHRYRSGHIGLDKIGSTLYRLTVAKLLASDKGDIYCEAGEWIQDPDRSWIKIASKRTEATALDVQSLGSVTDTFTAHIESSGPEFKEGETLEIKCSVGVPKALDHYFLVAWMKEGQELAAVGPTGVVIVGNTYAERHKNGEVQAIKQSDRDYIFTIKHIRTEDQGVFTCRVSEEEKGADGRLSVKESKTSSEIRVGVTARESTLRVSISNHTIQINEGEPLQLTCRAAGPTGPLSIAWQHKTSENTVRDVIGLRWDGRLEEGAHYRQRGQRGDVRAVRIDQGSFLLEIPNPLPPDAGSYKCIISEWAAGPSGDLQKIQSTSQEASVVISSLDSLIEAILRSRTMHIKEGENLELHCTVKGPQVPLSITWTFAQSGSSLLENIVSLLYNGSILWHKELSNFQIKTSVQQNAITSILKVSKSRTVEAGKYRCVVEAWFRDSLRATKLSNELAVQVKKPDSKLSISSEPKEIESTVNANVGIVCKILGLTSTYSQFAISWYFNKSETGKQSVLKTDRNLILEPGEIMKTRENKYHLQRESPDSFKLLILQTEFSDSGKYICEVEEWLQDPSMNWYSLSRRSSTTKLTIKSTEKKLKVMKERAEITVRDSEDFIVNCTINSDVQETSQFSVSWYRVSAASEKTLLLKWGKDFVLQGGNKELWKRAQFYSSARNTHHLVIRNADVADSGNYSCTVEEYELDGERRWQLLSNDESGFTSIVVHHPESNLQVFKRNEKVSINEKQSGFTVNCDIISYSDKRSFFEVTWLKRNGEEDAQPIFRALRSSTLQLLPTARQSLVFNRLSPWNYSLTIPVAEVTDQGTYSCQVEEWLLSPGNKWYKIANDTSGNLSVTITAKESTVFSTVCESQPLFDFVFIYPFIIIMLLITAILYLHYKLRKAGGSCLSSKKKEENSLWSDDCPLKLNPVSTDAAIKNSDA
uniref:Immunoglobulin superfamily, member 3-like n=1 Tax=Lepisosteus oculatus TaxID=7918 RepID=W5MZC0_LEPOC|nr:PREDICTED: immunoglobulin superfamily member 3-like [Lepisosteus oculatus]